MTIVPVKAATRSNVTYPVNYFEQGLATQFTGLSTLPAGGSIIMSVSAVTTGGKRRWKVRWREGTQQRSKTFERKEDAKLYDAEVTRKRRMGKLATLTDEL